MMGELKQIRISSLKPWVIASLSLKYIEVLLSFNRCTYQIFNHSKQTKIEEDMGLEPKRTQELFFSKHLSKLSLILFLHFFSCSFTFATTRTFDAQNIGSPTICMSNDTKITQFD
jgi:hypothetical protein